MTLGVFNGCLITLVVPPSPLLRATLAPARPSRATPITDCRRRAWLAVRHNAGSASAFKVVESAQHFQRRGKPGEPGFPTDSHGAFCRCRGFDWAWGAARS